MAPLHNHDQPGIKTFLAAMTPSMAPLRRYIYWTEEEVAEAVPGKMTLPDVSNIAPVASPVTTVEQKKAAPVASPNTVANCEQFSLSEGFDLFKAICDLAHRR